MITARGGRERELDGLRIQAGRASKPVAECMHVILLHVQGIPIACASMSATRYAARWRTRASAHAVLSMGTFCSARSWSVVVVFARVAHGQHSHRTGILDLEQRHITGRAERDHEFT